VKRSRVTSGLLTPGFGLFVASILAFGAVASADEGMWTFDRFPAASVQQEYGFAPDQKWLDRVQRATVRLENGCSGSVVSRDGLVLTNHHCVTECTTALSSPGNDYVRDGYYTAARKDEKICPGLEVSILKSARDVTDRVTAAVAKASPEAAASARADAIVAIEDEACAGKSRLRCDVASMYRGGQYKLHVYDRYDDVRIAFVPEIQAAFFGGDPDNFNYPRYALDMALLRLYRDGKLAAFADPLRIDEAGPKAGDLIFVSGYPSSTERLLTNAQLTFQRDHYLPWRIEYLSQFRGSLLTEAAKGEEEARQVSEALDSVENSLKVFKGQRGALVEPSFFAVKVADEQKLKDALTASADLQAKFGGPFATLSAIAQTEKRHYLPYNMLELRFGAGSVLLNDARTVYRSAVERDKPESSRLREYSASRLGSVHAGILAEAPVHPILEKLAIAFWLDKAREYLGPDHPAIRAIFGARTSREIAADIVENSQIGDTAFRKRMWADPKQAQASNDPALVLVRLVDAAAREARIVYEREVSIPTGAAAEKIAGLRFTVLGQNQYPDANFTLRLSYGVVKGWDDPVNGQIEPFTYMQGLWKRATGAYPFNLGARWIGGEDKLPPDMQYDFVSTNDIIGGNSGSPVLNRQGRVIGLAFDGNIHSTGGAYGFDPALNRMVSLSSQAIVGALRNIYGATALADELVK